MIKVKGRWNLKRYFFITPEGLNFQPQNDCSVPDFIDLRVSRFGQYQTLQDALNDLMELNENTDDDDLHQTLPLDLHNINSKLFMLKDYKEKIPLAS